VVHLAETLALQAAQTAAELAPLPRDDVLRHAGAVGAGRVALGADAFRDVEDDGDRQHVVLPGEPHQVGTRLALHIGGVHDGQPAGGEPLADDVVQHLERVAAGALVVLVVGDQAAAEVGGDHLGGLEVAAGEGGLAGPGGADQHDEAELGQAEGAGDGVRAGPRAGGSWCVLGAHVASFAVLSVRSVRSVRSVLVKTAIWVGGPTSGSSGPTGAYATA
jgi:hypothetical protein